MAGMSANDPVIVSTWSQFLAALGQNVKYIKWADAKRKYIQRVDINGIIPCDCEQVDFNGWTIDNLNIEDIQVSSVNDSIFESLGLVINLIINHLNYKKSAQPSVWIFNRLYSCYLLDINYESHDTAYDYGSYFDFPQTATARICFRATNCVLNIRSQDYAPRIPTTYAYNCVIQINYKWTKSGAGNTHLLFYAPGDVNQYDNCYIYGKLDLNEGQGEWQWTSVKGSSSPTSIIAKACIFNIETYIGDNCTFNTLRITSPAPSGATQWRQLPDKTMFVYDNGNAMYRYIENGVITSIPDVKIAGGYANVVRATAYNIRRSGWLNTRYWNFVDDDDYRVPVVNEYSDDVDRLVWRKSDYINDSVPFLPFYTYPVYEPPVIYPIERADRISVYDIYEPQSGFDHNGVAVLWPSEVTSYKEDKGRWDIELTHPIDQYGKWTYIIGQNCIKVNGQIFRIDETEICCDANQQYITAHANHITYDLNDSFIGDANFEVHSGTAYEAEIILASRTLIPTQQPTPYEYTFELTSDITAPFGGKLIGDFHDQTVTGALYGDDNSFANRYGGQLYRDNFHLSINSQMENLPAAPAFQIRYGTDMTKISYKIDFSSWVTELICENNFGELWAISYVGSEWIIHHNKTKRIHFTYAPGTPDTMGCLERDGFNYWLTVSTPKVSIEVSVANIRSDPKYKEFLNLQNMDVGYTGTVYFEQMGIDVDLKIVSIKRNELTGEAIQITLGNAPNSFIRSPVCSQTIVPNGSVEAKQAQTIKDMQTEIENVKLKSMKYWNGMKNYTWADVKKYKWEEIKNGKLNN